MVFCVFQHSAYFIFQKRTTNEETGIWLCDKQKHQTVNREMRDRITGAKQLLPCHSISATNHFIPAYSIKGISTWLAEPLMFSRSLHSLEFNIVRFYFALVFNLFYSIQHIIEENSLLKHCLGKKNTWAYARFYWPALFFIWKLFLFSLWNVSIFYMWRLCGNIKFWKV